MAKTMQKIYDDIVARLATMTDKTIADGTVIDLYTVAVAQALAEAYAEIDANKTPYIFSKQSGDDLDDTGFFLGCPRKAGEDDDTYRYRLMNWVKRNEAANETAIKSALLNLEYASNVEFVPLFKGAGTAACYIIPKTYDEATILNAINEVKAIMQKIASPTLYVEYIIPETLVVKVVASIAGNMSDLSYAKNNISIKTRTYINSIAPGDKLKVGEINKIGIAEPSITYFSVMSLYINDEEVKDIEILQKTDSKLLFDQFVWIDQ